MADGREGEEKAAALAGVRSSRPIGGETTECPVSPAVAQIATKQKPFFSGGRSGKTLSAS